MSLSVVNNAKLSVAFNWDVQKFIVGAAPKSSGGQYARSGSFTLGVGASQVNDVVGVIYSLAASGTVTIDMSSFAANVLGDAAVAARVKGLILWHLAVADGIDDGSGTPIVGGSASSLVIGAAGATPWTSILNATGTMTLPNGAWAGFGLDTAGGFAIAGGNKNLLVTNADAVNAGKLLFGALLGAT